jgi:hypothetical protein
MASQQSRWKRVFVIALGVLPWLVAVAAAGLAAPSGWAGLVDASGWRTVIGAALLCVLASVMALAMAAWRASAEGRRASASLGALYPVLMVYVSVTLSAAAVVTLQADGAPGRVGQSLLVLLLAGLVWLLGRISRKVSRNRLIGFRTARTLADDQTWAEVNARWGRRLEIASVFSLLGLLAGRYGLLVALLPAVIIGWAFVLTELRAAR